MRHFPLRNRRAAGSLGLLLALNQAANKLDKETEGARKVTKEQGKALADSHNTLVFSEVSAKSGANARAPFLGLVGEILKSPRLMDAARSKPDSNLVKMTTGLLARGKDLVCWC